jgi:hypothetical protein
MRSTSGNNNRPQMGWSAGTRDRRLITDKPTNKGLADASPLSFCRALSPWLSPSLSLSFSLSAERNRVA